MQEMSPGDMKSPCPAAPGRCEAVGRCRNLAMLPVIGGCVLGDGGFAGRLGRPGSVRP